MRRIIKKLINIAIICAVVIALAYILTNKPVVIKSTDLSLVGMDDDEITKEYEQNVIDKINAGNTTESCVYDGDKLPEEWEDGKFVTIMVDMTMRNITIFPIKDIVAEIEKPDARSQIVCSWSDEVPQNIKPFSKDKVTVMWMDMYYGDMDYDEIEKYISRQSVNINYSIPLFGKNRMRASLGDAKIVKVIASDENGNIINILDK